MSWALLITALLPTAINGIPGLASNIKQIITEIVGSVNAVLSSGVVQNQSPAEILQALAAVIAFLKAQPNVPTETLALIGVLDRAAQAGIVAEMAAQQKEDPTTLQPITPVP